MSTEGLWSDDRISMIKPFVKFELVSSHTKVQDFFCRLSLMFLLTINLDYLRSSCFLFSKIYTVMFINKTSVKIFGTVATT